MANLYMGSVGPEVRDLQLQLNMKYRSSPALAADGVFGARTLAAVLGFQRRCGLAPDGVVGPKTRAALAAALPALVAVMDRARLDSQGNAIAGVPQSSAAGMAGPGSPAPPIGQSIGQSIGQAVGRLLSPAASLLAQPMLDPMVSLGQIPSRPAGGPVGGQSAAGGPVAGAARGGVAVGSSGFGSMMSPVIAQMVQPVLDPMFSTTPLIADRMMEKAGLMLPAT